MSQHALFEGLVVDTEGKPVTVGIVGGEAQYIVDDGGFQLRVPAGPVDRAILACAGGGPGVQETENAVNTAVDLTLAALTPTSDHTEPPATPAPTIGIATARPTTFVPPKNATATPPQPPGPTLTPAPQI